MPARRGKPLDQQAGGRGNGSGGATLTARGGFARQIGWTGRSFQPGADVAPCAMPAENDLSLFGFVQLAVSTVIFLLAATCAKSWALTPGIGKLALTLALYSAGNLVMLRLVREFGMASAFSLSAIIQLVAINVIALAFFGERLSMVQSSGIVLAVLAVGLITLGPQAGGQ